MSPHFKEALRRKCPPLVTAWRWLLRVWRTLPQRVRFYDGVVRRVPGTLAMQMALCRDPGFSAEARAAYDGYSGGDLIDIGASLGSYGLILAPKARPGDRFVLMEPDPAAWPVLLENVGALAPLFPAIEFCLLLQAAGNGQGLEPHFPSAQNVHPSYVSRPLREGERPALTGDEVVTGLGLRPALIKIDVEGAEAFVIEGLAQTWRKFAPVIFLETHPDWMAEPARFTAACAQLQAAGFTRTRVLDERHEIWSKPEPASRSE